MKMNKEVKISKEIEIREAFHNQLKKEYNKYIKKLKKQKVNTIIDYSFETAIKDRIIYLFDPINNSETSSKYKNVCIDIDIVKILLNKKVSLDWLYAEWISYLDDDCNDCTKYLFKGFIDCFTKAFTMRYVYN